MLAKSVLVCLLFATVALAAKLTPLYDVDKALDYFLNFVQKYDKSYGHGEAASRFQIFTDNLARLNRFNEEHGHHGFRIHRNLDITDKEFASTHYGLNLKNVNITEPPSYIYGDITAPDSYDWRDHGVVSPIQKQLRQDCYAFSSVATMESQYAIKKGSLIKLSEQQVDDCDTQDDPNNGGLPLNVFNYAVGAGGMMSEADYPYVGSAQQCLFQADKAQVKIASGDESSKSEEEMMDLLVNYGPFSIGILSTPTFSNAVGFTGVLAPTDCNGANANHAINIVGYGTDNGTPYWILRNSWGTEWGDQGYIKFIRGKNLCQITSTIGTAQIA